MQSFRSELEDLKNPVVAQDIIDLEKKIRLFREGNINEEHFRSLRLARGIYGQRQPGVQMIRIKLPFGRVSTAQWQRICDVSDEYATKKLHLTTRQDVQIHFVSLDRTPQMWADLEKDDVTIREACGNTVRNVTASAAAGIDPEELFDVSPYAYETFRYFLRNPICQELGRKFKIAFSSSERDTAFTFIHDVGVIPKVRIENGQELRGFKVLVGGGLGAQPFLALPIYEFLHEDLLIPYIEAVLRVFDRYGERARRHKARLKYLIQEIGIEAFIDLVEKEKPALPNQVYKIDIGAVQQPAPPAEKSAPAVNNFAKEKYARWLKANVFEQKQKGYFSVQAKVLTGDISTEKARQLIPLVKEYAADEIRVTVNQGLLFKFIRQENLLYFFTQLDQLGLAEAGFGSVADITSCPGTDTCNLGISNSTEITRVLEKMIDDEYPHLVFNKDIQIKLSGCMNSCGQHSMAQIGFHGSSLRNGPKVLPALQLVMGGGPVGNGLATVSEKIIKVPSKRGPDTVRALLNDYEEYAEDGEPFNIYYKRQGKDYFYQLLKPFADLTNVQGADYIDWGHKENYKQEVGVGECAGVVIDLVATLILESEEKYVWAARSFEANAYADAIYHAYSAMVSAAKALLLGKQVLCNTHHGIINDFDKHFIQDGSVDIEGDFKTYVSQIDHHAPTKEFAVKYLADAQKFLNKINKYANKATSDSAAGAKNN